ncbi:MAG: hypothetical protein CL760_08960 [Chloroflexi bacterium]|nr:hypothetical protein [Chloroflexota bacterium]|tara:strand:- start:53385 stop:53993 length:609 start_codon:yes stop_codon:yes gene_type:complete
MKPVFKIQDLLAKQLKAQGKAHNEETVEKLFREAISTRMAEDPEFFADVLNLATAKQLQKQHTEKVAQNNEEKAETLFDLGNVLSQIAQQKVTGKQPNSQKQAMTNDTPESDILTTMVFMPFVEEEPEQPKSLTQDQEALIKASITELKKFGLPVEQLYAELEKIESEKQAPKDQHAFMRNFAEKLAEDLNIDSEDIIIIAK